MTARIMLYHLVYKSLKQNPAYRPVEDDDRIVSWCLTSCNKFHDSLECSPTLAPARLWCTSSHSRCYEYGVLLHDILKPYDLVFSLVPPIRPYLEIIPENYRIYLFQSSPMWKTCSVQYVKCFSWTELIALEEHWHGGGSKQYTEAGEKSLRPSAFLSKLQGVDDNRDLCRNIGEHILIFGDNQRTKW